MIYTIGDKQSYTAYFAEQGNPKKKGRTKDYVGGSVFKTKEDALKFCPEGFEVYGVLADWETQTVKSKDGPWNDLLIDSLLVTL